MFVTHTAHIKIMVLLVNASCVLAFDIMTFIPCFVGHIILKTGRHNVDL